MSVPWEEFASWCFDNYRYAPSVAENGSAAWDRGDRTEVAGLEGWVAGWLGIEYCLVKAVRTGVLV